MRKREASFTLLFRHWLKANPMRTAAVFELKQTQTDSFPFKNVEEHQLEALAAAWGPEGLIYKISDQSQGYKPCDIVYFRLSPAYIVIKYPKFFCLIHASAFGAEMKTSTRKSLTSERAKEIAEKVIELPKKTVKRSKE